MKKKMMKKVFMMCILSGMVFSIAGCGNDRKTNENDKQIKEDSKTSIENENSEKAQKEPMFLAKDAIKIEEIDWSVAGGVLDGERFISFNYTNNSKYTIMDIEMEFRQKEGTSLEQLSVFDSLKTEREWSEEDVKDIYILGYNRKFADPGETVSDSPCVINGTYTALENLEQYEVMEPNMVTIAFIYKGKGYIVYYDFKTQAYGDSSYGAKNLQEWSDSKISSLLPKANSTVVEISNDEEDDFSFNAYGVSREDFAEYISLVKIKGFTTIDFEGTDSYTALNADGIEAHFSYNMTEETMYGSVSKE